MGEPTATGHPGNWRWTADTYYTRHHTINVIEPPASEPKAEGRKVPFGFARELEPEPREPQLWDGDNG